MSYCHSEEEFLSAYTSAKLIRGGKPVVSKEELEAVRDKFLLSVYCSDNLIKPLTNLNFDDLQSINERFQQKASKNRSWLKPCFEYKDGKLYPTYDFFDFTQTTYGEFLSFLFDDRYKDVIPLDLVDGDIANADIKYLPNAKKVADYLTKHFAKQYIEKEAKAGKWPLHMRDISNIFKKDLGAILELEGTKEYFRQFHKHAQTSIAILLTKENGNLIISDKKYGDLKYNNLKRILNATPIFERMCSASWIKGQSKFDIKIQDDIIKCNETTLVMEDPYDDDDYYSHEEKSL